MTEKQKKAFLKAEGWKRCDIEFCSGWRDPVDQKCWTTESAYRIASRRKRQREARALRKAIWTYGDFQCFNDEPHAFGWWHPKHPSRHTRQEALQTLENQP